MLVQDQPIHTPIPLSRPAPSRVGTVLVTGSTGLLGSVLCTVLAGAGHRVLRHRRLRPENDNLAFPLEQLALIGPAIQQCRPDWIVHAAANTSVDACETDPAAARRLHVEASAELARAARLHGSRLLYVSTDSVYDGDRAGAHREEDATRPLNEYARTKRAGEQASLQELPSTVVTRVNFFGVHPDRTQGLVAWILGRLKAGQALDGFTDVEFSPLLGHDLALLLGEVIHRDLPGGIYNVGASDSCSKFQFARRIACLLGADERLVRPATLADARLAAPRPRNTVMNTTRLAGILGGSLPTVEAGLVRLLAARGAGR